MDFDIYLQLLPLNSLNQLHLPIYQLSAIIKKLTAHHPPPFILFIYFWVWGHTQDCNLPNKKIHSPFFRGYQLSIAP